MCVLCPISYSPTSSTVVYKNEIMGKETIQRELDNTKKYYHSITTVVLLPYKYASHQIIHVSSKCM